MPSHRLRIRSRLYLNHCSLHALPRCAWLRSHLGHAHVSCKQCAKSTAQAANRHRCREHRRGLLAGIRLSPRSFPTTKALLARSSVSVIYKPFCGSGTVVHNLFIAESRGSWPLPRADKDPCSLMHCAHMSSTSRNCPSRASAVLLHPGESVSASQVASPCCCGWTVSDSHTAYPFASSQYSLSTGLEPTATRCKGRKANF